MEVSTFVSVTKVIWDVLLASKAEIIASKIINKFQYMGRRLLTIEQRNQIIRNSSGFCQYVTSVRITSAVHIEIIISATENYYHRRRRTHS